MSTLKILVMSDIHDRFEAFAPEQLPDADLCLIAGDLTNYGIRGEWRLLSGGALRSAQALGLDVTAWMGEEVTQAKAWLERMAQKYPILWIPGNHDIGIRADSFGTIANCTCILNQTVEFAGLKIHGVSMSPCYNLPILAEQWDYMTADPNVERAAYAFEPVDVVVSHSPPLDCLDSGGHILGEGRKPLGSPALREYILTHSPRLVVCGHIHEGRGQARLASTDVVNLAETWQVLSIETN